MDIFQEIKALGHKLFRNCVGPELRLSGSLKNLKPEKQAYEQSKFGVLTS
jgi:hypothetical protein